MGCCLCYLQDALEKLPFSWEMAAGANTDMKPFLVNLYRTYTGFTIYKFVHSFRQSLVQHFKILLLTSLAFVSTLF